MAEQETSALIVGAGKVGRGFIAHLLSLAGVRVTFLEWSRELVAAMAGQGHYHIYIAGEPMQEHLVQGFRIVDIADAEQVADLVAETDLVFTAIGGERLPALGPVLAPGIARRAVGEAGVLNVITCENWTHPGALLRASIAKSLPSEAVDYLENCCGVAESTVYRGCIEPTPEQKAFDPLAVQGTDYWQLQVDGDKLRAPVPEIAGIVPIAGFQSALEKKLFTYSALSATISYLGALLGFRLLHDAATDPRVVAIARVVLRESGTALCRRHGHSAEEQDVHAEESLAAFQDSRNPDTVERHARDPLRKLSRFDRLVGPACLCLEEGVEPKALGLTIAVAMRYAEQSDPAAVTLQVRMASQGIDTVLADVCGLDPHGHLALLVKAQIPRIADLLAGSEVVTGGAVPQPKTIQPDFPSGNRAELG